MKAARLTVVICLCLLTACAMTVSQRKDSAYKTMAVLGNSYDSAMKAVAKLSQEGIITDEEKRAAMRVAAVFWTAYHETLLAMEIWWAVEDSASEERFTTALNELMSKYKDMMSVLEPLLKRSRG